MPVILAASVENAEILLALFLMLAAAKIMAEVFERLRQILCFFCSILKLKQPSNSAF